MGLDRRISSTRRFSKIRPRLLRKRRETFIWKCRLFFIGITFPFATTIWLVLF